ncbi:MAG: EAL domain-containing protein, partial [Eubacteriales bacterium]
MDKIKLWQTYFDTNSSPCVVTDKETVEILYCNNAFLQIFEKGNSIIGKYFYDIIPLTDCYMEEKLPDWDNQDYYETESYNETLNMRFLMKATLDKSNNSVFCIMIPTESDIISNVEFEKAMTRCVEIFDKEQESRLALEELSFLMSEFYDSEVGYIYHFDEVNDKVVCVAHYTAPDYKPNGGATTSVGMAAIIKWFQDENTPTIVMGDIENDKEAIHPTLLDIIHTFQVRNIAFHKVQDGKGNFVGMVGVTNRRNPTKLFDRRLIATIARFVAQDVVNGLADSTLFHHQHRDSLTGFYNRDGYALVLKEIWENKPKTLGVISANINGLKITNENEGITGGDKLIKDTATRIKEHFGIDFFRLSGDEFLGIAPNMDSRTFAEKVTSLHDSMRKEGNYDFSFGHAFASGNMDLSKLILESDTIMYINKQEYYSSTKRQFDTVRDNILSELLSYIANDEFLIYLQPQVRLEDGSLYGAEALIRRFDKTNQKMVFPDQFIPLYEQKSIIRHVDIFVVETVCQLLQKWSKGQKGLPISVNLSRVTLQENGIVDAIVKICDKYDVPHELLVIEVTERVGLIENNVASA